MDEQQALGVLREASAAVGRTLEHLEDRGPSGIRDGQYQLDLVADEAVLGVLLGAGLSVLSEESGVTEGPRDLLAVVDPVDGSTNASRGIPWYSTSICVLDDEGPWVALVEDHAREVTYEAVRGGGATRNGRAISATSCREVSGAIVAITGFPDRHPGWAQFRVLGSAALELCAVADGTLDGFMAAGGFGLYVWDYLGAWLVCREAGAVLAEQDGRDLVIRDDRKRRVVGAATPELLASLLGSVGP